MVFVVKTRAKNSLVWTYLNSSACMSYIKPFNHMCVSTQADQFNLSVFCTILALKVVKLEDLEED